MYLNAQSYLKEVLNEIAILDKKGHYNNCYHLKPEYSQKNSAAEPLIAPQGLEAPNVIGNAGNGGEQVEYEEEDLHPRMESDDDPMGEGDDD